MNLRRVRVDELPPEIRAIVDRICRRCGLSTSGEGGAVGYADGTWTHVVCGGSPLVDVCECGDWEADHVLRRRQCRVCACASYVFDREEPMPPAMYRGDEPRLPAGEVRPLYDDVRRVEAAVDELLKASA